MVRIDRSEAPLSPQEIDKVCKTLGILLPESYRQFLLQHNGGRPKPDFFRYKSDAGRECEGMVDWFLAMYDGEHDNFCTYFQAYRGRRRRVPAHLVPIAHDAGGNLICIDCGIGSEGAVFFWDHEEESERDDEPSMRNVHLIAGTFAEFLLKFEPYPDAGI